LLGGGDVITITGRSADSQWLQIRLADNAEAWVFAEYINVSSTSAPLSSTTALGGITTTPITGTTTAAPSTPVSSTPVTPTTTITGTIPSTRTIVPGQTPAASVSSLSGANARLTPDRNAESIRIIPYDAVLTVRGRSANNEWLQVDYENQTVWVLVTTISLNTDLASLTVVNP
jgi:uncharacterized protein YraI